MPLFDFEINVNQDWQLYANILYSQVLLYTSL
jgi:hypothetical protein